MMNRQTSELDAHGHRRYTKPALLLVCMLVVGTLLFLTSPAIGCAYMNYRFKHCVHVEVEIPSCSPVPPGTGSFPCQYVFAFEGEQNPGAVHFADPGLRHVFDTANGTFRVTGTGVINHGRNVIKISSSQVFFDGREIPFGSRPVRGLVNRKGKLLTAYCEMSW
jgi:hypothetical protein